MFDNINKRQKEKAFSMFVSSVLRSIAAQYQDEILFEYNLKCYDNNQGVSDIIIDAYAPRGIGESINQIFFIYKYNLNITDSLIFEYLNKFNNSININVYKPKIVFITNNIIDLKDEIISKFVSDNYIQIDILDYYDIKSWPEKYKLDYNNTIFYFKNNIVDIADKELIDYKDFELQKQKNISVLRNEIKYNDNFALVLGAGVSVDIGAKSWEDLLDSFKNKLKCDNIINDIDKLCDKVGNSNLINAQLCKEQFKYKNDYYWMIHQGLYENYIHKIEYEIDEIVNLISKCINKKHFRVLTYNFDDYLEQRLNDKKISYDTLFNSNTGITKNLSIYHVHGYLPRVKYKKHIRDEHKDSIYLTEQDYNELYNRPYSWQISSQLSFFRENMCLFIGCSLSDPNIRRLLEISKCSYKKHYAILTKSGMTFNDLAIASNHFARLGIEIIWINSYYEIISILKQLY